MTIAERIAQFTTTTYVLTVPAPGFIANTGPYYAKVTVNATHTHKHIVNRLFTASSSEDTYPNEQATITVSTYAYAVHDGAAGPVRGSTFQEQGE